MDSYATAVVGVEIDIEKLYFDEKIESCRANGCTKKKECPAKENSDFKFCPECGKKPWKLIQKPIKDWDECDQKLGKFKVHFSTDQQYAVVGVLATDLVRIGYDDKEISFAKLPSDIEKQKQEIKEFLEPLGLWDEEKFGMWSVGCCSY